MKTKRNENNYREFSDEDIEKLKQIKLMRSLGITLADIKRYLARDVSLKNILEQHIAELQFQKQEIEDQQELCKLMKEKDIPMVHEVVESYQKIKDKEQSDEIKHVLNFHQSEKNRRWIIKRFFLYCIATFAISYLLYIVIFSSLHMNGSAYDMIGVVIGMMLLSFLIVVISLHTDMYQFRENGLYFSRIKEKNSL